MAHSMFHSPYESLTRETKSEESEKNDGQGEPLKKASRTSEITHSLNVHGDGSASTHTPEEGLKKHDSFESASEHLSHAVGKGDEFGMGEEKHASSKPSVRTKNPPADDMSGAGM
jgi:hypothetical protein